MSAAHVIHSSLGSSHRKAQTISPLTKHRLRSDTLVTEAIINWVTLHYYAANTAHQDINVFS